LVVDWAEVIDGGVPPSGGVEALDGVDDAEGGFVTIAESDAIEQLTFQTREE
jgi:hypothetical protein